MLENAQMEVGILLAILAAGAALCIGACLWALISLVIYWREN